MLGQISFSLYLDIKTVGNIRDHHLKITWIENKNKDKNNSNYINKFADSEHKMFKDNDECKFQGQDVPVYRSEVSLLVSEAFVVTIALKI